MSKKRTVTTLVKDAAEAHSNLNLFASIVSLLEGGHLYSNCSASATAAERIILICHIEEQRQLRMYDRAVAMIGRANA